MRYLGTKDLYRNQLFHELIRFRFKSVFRILKLWWQWLTKGISDDELWSFDVTIAKFILPRLKRFKVLEEEIHDNGRGYMDDLDKAIRAMDLIANTDCDWLFDEKQRQEVEEGLKIFAEIFPRLWN